MANQTFWVQVVVWLSGTWKTKNEFQKAYKWKQERIKSGRKHIIIANVPYDFVDIFYSSNKDLKNIWDWIYKYIKDTNDPATLWLLDIPDIYWIMDEAHQYFFSRDFKNIDANAVKVTPQIRKRFIELTVITQNVWQLDLFFRRLSEYTVEYTHGNFLYHAVRNVYYNKLVAPNDLWDVTQAELVDTKNIPKKKWYNLLSKYLPWWNIDYKPFFQQEYLTEFVICPDDDRLFYGMWFHRNEPVDRNRYMTYEDFYQIMNVQLDKDYIESEQNKREEQRLQRILSNVDTPSNDVLSEEEWQIEKQSWFVSRKLWEADWRKNNQESWIISEIPEAVSDNQHKEHQNNRKPRI